jgi:hypothetical protein
MSLYRTAANALFRPTEPRVMHSSISSDHVRLCGACGKQFRPEATLAETLQPSLPTAVLCSSTSRGNPLLLRSLTLLCGRFTRI